MRETERWRDNRETDGQRQQQQRNRHRERSLHLPSGLCYSLSQGFQAGKPLCNLAFIKENVSDEAKKETSKKKHCLNDILKWQLFSES